MRKFSIAAVGALLTLAAAQLALAQDPGSTGVSSELERTASTTPQEKIAYAESSNEEIRDAEKQIAKLLEAAKRDSDAEAIQCLTSRLTSVRALQQVSEAAEVSMKDAIAAGQDEKASHEFRKIAVAVSKTRMLLAEAQRCAQDQTLESGVTLLDWETSLQEETDFDDPLDIDMTDFFQDPPPISVFQ